MGGFEKVALKKAADYAALEFRKTIDLWGGAFGSNDPSFTVQPAARHGSRDL